MSLIHLRRRRVQKREPSPTGLKVWKTWCGLHTDQSQDLLTTFKPTDTECLSCIERAKADIIPYQPPRGTDRPSELTGRGRPTPEHKRLLEAYRTVLDKGFPLVPSRFGVGEEAIEAREVERLRSVDRVKAVL